MIFIPADSYLWWVLMTFAFEFKHFAMRISMDCYVRDAFCSSKNAHTSPSPPAGFIPSKAPSPPAPKEVTQDLRLCEASCSDFCANCTPPERLQRRAGAPELMLIHLARFSRLSLHRSRAFDKFFRRILRNCLPCLLCLRLLFIASLTFSFLTSRF